VWRCVSPKKTRVGNARSAYGEYGRFAGNDFSRDSVVAEPVSCAIILGALAATSPVMNVTKDKNRVQLRLIGRSISFEGGVAPGRMRFRFSFKARRGTCHKCQFYN